MNTMTGGTTSEPGCWDDMDFLARLTADAGPDVSCVIDPDGVLRYAGGSSERLLGRVAAEQIGSSIWEFVHPDDLIAAAGALNEASRSNGYHQPAIFRVRHGRGDWIECEVNGVTVDGPGGSWVIMALRGLSDRDEVMGRRRSIEQLIQIASLECSGVAWSEVGALAERFLGELAAVVRALSVELAWQESDGLRIGADWGVARERGLAADDSLAVFEALWPIEDTCTTILRFSSSLSELPETVMRDRLVDSGVRAAVEVPLSVSQPWAVLRLTFGEHWLDWDDVNVDLVAVLATTLMATLRRCFAEEHLRRQASTDPLTGLMNRAELYRLLESNLSDDQLTGDVGVIYGDLNLFKRFNDDLGHGAGDDLLVSVAHALRASVRAVDLVARFGGDEFVVVCPDLEHPEQLDHVMDRVHDAVLHLGEPGHRISMSLGGVIGRPGQGSDELLRLADEAMYRAKRAARVLPVEQRLG